MKLISQIISPVLHGGAVAPKMPAKPGNVDLALLPPESQELFNGIFRQLRAIFPAWRQTLTSQKDADEYRRQLVLALIEAHISQLTQLEAGLAIAREQNTPYLPGPGQFVTWCREGVLALAGFPDLDATLEEFRRYMNRHYLYEQPADYPWCHPVLFWIVGGLIKSGSASDADLRRKAEKLLSDWGRYVLAGREVPEPIRQIADKARGQSLAQKMGREDELREKGDEYRASLAAKRQSNTTDDHCGNQAKKVSKQ